MSSYYIGAYWPDRPESAGECAERMSECFRKLSEVDPVFEDVRFVATTKTEYPRVQASDVNALTSIFEQGRNREDVPPRRVIEKLGYSASFISRERLPEQKWVIRINCGVYASNPNLLNRCVLNIPGDGEVATRLLDRSSALEMMQALVTAWDPDWAVLQSTEFRRLIAPTVAIPGPALIGWMVYFSDRAGVVPEVDVFERIELPRQGTLLVLREQPISATDQDDILVAQALRDKFVEAKLIPV